MSRHSALAFLTLLVLAGGLSAQGPDRGNGTRVGLSLGGISTVSLWIEFFRNNRSVEVGVGTWAFRDLSVAGTVRQYFGGAAAQPFVGGGLWAVVAPSDGGRTGVALVLRAPVGVDWSVTARHAIGASLNANYGLLARRSDPDDDWNNRFVPLPEVYYRFTR